MGKRFAALTLVVICFAFVAHTPATPDGHARAETRTAPSPRIFGGFPLAPSEPRFTIALLAGNRFICSGALISSTRVLTAAHCTQTPDPLTVIAGRDYIGDPGGEVIGVSKVAVDPYYNGRANDLAVLSLVTPSSLPSVSLPTLADEQSYLYRNSPFTAAGFGSRRFTGRGRTGALRVVQLRLGGGCRFFYRGFSIATQLCVRGAFGPFGLRRGPCNGDSGGPLVARVPDGRVVTVGVSSYGGVPRGPLKFVKCGLLPDVYARVGPALDFINSNLGP